MRLGGAKSTVRLTALLTLLVAALAARVAPKAGRNLALAGLERRGDLCFQGQDARTALALWDLVLAEAPERASVRNKLAVLHLQQGDAGQAEKLLAAGLAAAPREESFHFNLALVHCAEGRYTAALDSLSTVERLNPGHGRVHYLRGVIYDRCGQHEAAQKEFVKELNNDPATVAAWARLGLLPGSRRGAPAGETGAGRTAEVTQVPASAEGATAVCR